jgi:cobalt-zinc-cadmium efflux system membrane fusion protein
VTRPRFTLVVRAMLILGCSVTTVRCSVHGSSDPSPGAPPVVPVEQEGDGGVVHVDHPDQFPVVTATQHDARSALSVTGVVSPDVSRTVPVISLASGRVIDLRARLGDQVQQGQLLLRIQSADVSGAFSDHRKAVMDEALARAQLTRATVLFDKGAVARKDLEVAEDAANKAVVDEETTAEHLRVLGMNASETSTAIVNVMAPVSGVITEQNVTNAAGVKTLDNSPNLFTISDLSHVWIVCDVYENDLPAVREGDTAEIHLTAYRDRTLTGRISNVSATLDPAIRTAKVRIEVANPGLLRLGMFVTATFHGQSRQSRAVVPAAAILHLHDREWVYVPAADAAGFQRVEVISGEMLSDHMQELVSGLQPGQRVVSKALVLQNTVEQ